MNLLESIHFQNSHWGKGKFDTFNFKRHIFSNVYADIETKLIALITGPRRVGKSVLLKQLANEIITGREINPNQIILFEFSPAHTQEKIWEVYRYFTKEISDPRLPQFLLFDEIQYLEAYESTIKEIYDNSQNTKIILTGSLSLSYKRRMEESLAGRFFSYKILPLNFSEYLELAKPETFAVFKKAQAETNKLRLQYDLAILNAEFRNFLSFGRLPEMVNFTKDQSENYLRTILNQSLNQDAFNYFEIEKPQTMNSLFDYLKINNGGLISINSLAQSLAASNQTISLYLNILEIMGLIYLLYNSTNPLIKLNSSKKSYVSSAYALLETKLNLVSSIGFAVESYILERLLEKGETVTFWKKRDKEIDFLLPKKKLAYEIKYRSKIKIRNVSLFGYKLEVISLDGQVPACLF